jgi:hypothetical protein
MLIFFNFQEGTMSDYLVQKLSDELIYIRWHQTPGDKSRRDYLKDIQQLLDETTHPLYFISDLRHGRISDLNTLRALIKILDTDKYGGSSSFCEDPTTRFLAGAFEAFTGTIEGKDKTCDTPDEAVAFLETLKPGLTEHIDWKAVFLEEA